MQTTNQAEHDGHLFVVFSLGYQYFKKLRGQRRFANFQVVSATQSADY
jgi:hypothetical protein